MRASHIYLTVTGVKSLAFAMIGTTYAVYLAQVLGFNPLQLVLAGTAMEAAIMLFEVPTGIVADGYSRRLSVIIGVLIIGSAVFLEGWQRWSSASAKRS